MPGEVERFVRIQNIEIINSFGQRGAEEWRTIQHGERVRVLGYSTLIVPHEETGVDEKRHVFRIRHVSGIHKGSRVTYFGNDFRVIDVHDPGGLTGLELSCTAEQH